jgi:hypothetical protein
MAALGAMTVIDVSLGLTSHCCFWATLTVNTTAKEGRHQAADSTWRGELTGGEGGLTAFRDEAAAMTVAESRGVAARGQGSSDVLKTRLESKIGEAARSMLEVAEEVARTYQMRYCFDWLFALRRHE